MAAVVKVSVSGSLPSGELWSVNPVFNLSGSPAVSYEEALAAATLVAARTVPTGLRQTMSLYTFLHTVKVEARSLSGTLEALAEVGLGAPVGGSGTGPGPNQLAIVGSLRTTHPGASGRGRLYWPATGLGIDAATGRYVTSDALAVATGLRTYLSGIEGDVSSTIANSQLVVWSRTNSAAYPVTRILVGNVPDVQRRRRDTLAEAYSTLTYPG